MKKIMTTTYKLLIASVVSAIALTSCVKDDLFDTPHPAHGRITLTTDWTERTGGVDIPATYNVNIGGYSGTATGAIHEIDYLFTPDDYRIIVHNPVENITVSGTTATVAAVSGNRNGVGDFISNAPGTLFTHVRDVTIGMDRDHAFVAAMRQQVRRLTVIIEATGDAAPRIEGIDGYISGAAGSLDFAGDIHGAPSNVAMNFTKVAEGADAGKWTATAWLLGTSGAGQKLTARLRFADNNPLSFTFESDVTEALAGFNSDKTHPLVIGSTLIGTSTAGGFEARIGGWKVVDGGDINAH